MKREMPDFSKWLETVSPGLDRAEAEDFALFVDWVQRSAAVIEGTGPEYAKILFTGLSIGMVETMRAACRKADLVEVITCMGRMTGTVLFSATMSVMRDDVPARELAAILREELRHGLNVAADSYVPTTAEDA